MTGDRNVDLLRRGQRAANLSGREQLGVEIDIETGRDGGSVCQPGQIRRRQRGALLRGDGVEPAGPSVDDLRSTGCEVDDHRASGSRSAAMNVRSSRAGHPVRLHLPSDGVVHKIKCDQRGAECRAAVWRRLVRTAQLRCIHRRSAADKRKLPARRAAGALIGVHIHVVAAGILQHPLRGRGVNRECPRHCAVDELTAETDEIDHHISRNSRRADVNVKSVDRTAEVRDGDRDGDVLMRRIERHGRISRAGARAWWHLLRRR